MESYTPQLTAGRDVQGSDDREKVQLFLSCRNLPNMDVLSKSDPQVKVYIADGKGRFFLLDQTEVVADNLNPEFKKIIILDHIFERRQTVKFEVVDVDMNDRFEHIGEVVTTLGKIIGSRGGTAELELIERHNQSKRGTLIVYSEKIRSTNEVIRMKWKAENLPDVSGWFSKFAPNLRFFRSRDDGAWIEVHTTESTSSTSPSWKEFNIRKQKLCSGFMDKAIKLEVWHGKKKVIGMAFCTLRGLLTDYPQKLPLTKTSGNGSSGFIILESASIVQNNEFLDYIMGGTQLNAMIAIDYTVSNKDPRRRIDRHQLTPHRLNDYQLAINKIVDILLAYDNDKKIPVYGYGGKPRFPILKSEDTWHCFPLTGKPNDPEVVGLEGVMKAYRRAVRYVELSGPTYFGPLLREASELAQRILDSGEDIYLVLLILTDGVIHDMQATKNLLVAASRLPLSVIIVGIGDADFSDMVTLDGDTGLVDIRGKKADRDLCQFVPWNSVKAVSYTHLTLPTIYSV
eukprot:TRINITY_DN12114_c0_g1_i2.p1 TRINITY_DN12114_c0_g1~~TRINITY_DN12114_c0_g1_i2.p1  ORF type:complete len:513 (-),score=66.55 TRINITY_DN12114_c0_g1_i2:35-1573(-)